MSSRTIVDLYAGAGGLSLGFSQAGYKIAAAVEVDEWAAETFSSNLHTDCLRISDAGELGTDFFKTYKGVDVVVGGPPCQGFSICASNRRDPNDERNLHPFIFLDAVRKLRPHAVVIENVPEIKRARLPNGSMILDRIYETLLLCQYHVRTFELNAANFGVPQLRQRIFIIASRNQVPDLAEYRTNAKGASSMFSEDRWITVSEALSDLPAVAPRELLEDQELPYEKEPLNDYQRIMRQGSDILFNHVPMRHTPRLVERFKAIPVGGNGVDVWSSHSARKRGMSQSAGTPFHQNHRRLRPDQPAPTITAYCYSTFLHPWEHRNLTVREAARLQSFPDSFRFYGKRTTLSKKLLERKGLPEHTKLNQLNQVGNAVPPILAFRIAQAVLRTFGD